MNDETMPRPDLQQLIAELIRKHLADAPNSPEAMDALAADLAERVELLRAGILANRDRAFAAEVERDHLKAANDRVRALHTRTTSAISLGPVCGSCIDAHSEQPAPWPCPTIAAFDQPADSKEAR